MDRLTIRNTDGSVSQPTDLNWAEALERLAAYEDTGLDPEEIKELEAECETAEDSLATAYAGWENWEGLATKYLNAEKEGCLIVLPCKVGDTVYRLWPCGKHGRSISKMVVKHIDIDYLPEIKFSCRKETGRNYWFFKVPDIGKTVFLTREEAEKALEASK